MFLRELARRASMGRREGAATAATAASQGGESGAAFAGAASPPRATLLGGGGAGRPAGAPPASPGPRTSAGAASNPAARAPEPPGPPERGPLIRGVGACEEANPRFRPSHEDAHSVDTGGDGATGSADAPCEPPHGALFGVYDGHGGADVARCVRRGGDGQAARVTQQLTHTGSLLGPTRSQVRRRRPAPALPPPAGAGPGAQRRAGGGVPGDRRRGACGATLSLSRSRTISAAG
jgi:hypothetical protein